MQAEPKSRIGAVGHAPRFILEEAEDFGADLIVLGSRGLTDFSALLLGSVAHKVIHHADLPVLVVR